MDEAKPRVDAKMREQKLEEENQPILERPVGENKTWGEFKTELDAYLRQNVSYTGDLSPSRKNPRPEDIPYFRQLTQYLIAAGRFGSEELSRQTIDPEELHRETQQLLKDPGYLRLLRDEEFRQLMAGRWVKRTWNRIREASEEEYAKLGGGQASPYRYDVPQTRQKLRDAVERDYAPLKTAIGAVCTRLTDERYNADIRKTGFLFFKPSDTGLYQEAVKELKTLNDAEVPYRTADLERARKAVRAYLDDRKSVRSHEYGKRRWEKLMCAYKTLEDPQKFEDYCAELNAHRGFTDPKKDGMNPDYVYPSAFGPERMDLENPHVPQNEAYRQMRQDYAKANAAGEKDALLRYFSRVAAMRTQAAQNDGDLGMLVDMKKVREQAEVLYHDSGFRKLLKEENRKALLEKATKLLSPNSNDWTVEAASREQGKQEKSKVKTM